MLYLTRTPCIFTNRGLGQTSFEVDFSSFDKPDKKSINQYFSSDGVHTVNSRVSSDTKKKGEVEAGPNLKQFYSLEDIMDMLGHRDRTLHVLKVDVEGAEVILFVTAIEVYCTSN